MKRTKKPVGKDVVGKLVIAPHPEDVYDSLPLDAQAFVINGKKEEERALLVAIAQRLGVM